MSLVAFTLGLLGSLHCLFMCGPLVMGVTRLSQAEGSNLILYAVIYNFGRISAYIAMGVVFALIGKGFSLLGIQQILSMVTGILLLVLVLASLDLERFLFRFGWMRNIYQMYGAYLNRKIVSLAKSYPFVLGMFNGLLPCGMVYIALAGALGATTISAGALFMMSFGLGTLPMMVLIMAGWQKLPRLKWLNRKIVIPVGQTVLGVYLVFRGATAALPLDWF